MWTCYSAVLEDNRTSVREGRNHRHMMEAGWSARRLHRQLGHSDCIVRRFGDQWIREMSFTRRPDSGRPRQTSRQEEHHIVRNARVQPTASSAAILEQVSSRK
ncbi:HTH_Tnp_Tc3_2 domain-containing protein [Trichonephila clavipes]|nr:HTH_Tnp_Tc3_2 domain-containing protein [Trichonephila clavipes]